MAADSTRHPREEQLPWHDDDLAADGAASGDDGETLAEKIHRYRQPGPGAPGGVPPSGRRVVRSPREA